MKIIIYITLILLLFTASAFAASGSLYVDIKPPELVSANAGYKPVSGLFAKAGKYDIAVVIGNRNYKDRGYGIPNVDFALNDARAMKKYLTKVLGYREDNVIYLEDATTSQFIEVFGSDRSAKGKLYKYVKNGVSRVIVYYVGHGAPDLDSKEAFFVPVDANPQYIAAMGFSLQTFYRNLDKLPAKHVTIMLDACFSGQSSGGLLFKNISPIMLKVDKNVITPKKALLITSAAVDQVSSWYVEKKHSMFTYYLLKGMQGEADMNKDGDINVSELKSYLVDNVSYMAQRLNGIDQVPVVYGTMDQKLIGTGKRR